MLSAYRGVMKAAWRLGLVSTDDYTRAVDVKVVKKLQEGNPNLIDYLVDGAVKLIINTPNGKGARTDEGRIRAAAVAHGVPCITTIPAVDAALKAIEALRTEPMTVQPLQERFAAAAAPPKGGGAFSGKKLPAGANSLTISLCAQKLSCSARSS